MDIYVKDENGPEKYQDKHKIPYQQLTRDAGFQFHSLPLFPEIPDDS
jgi:hypothetical protein